MDLTVLKVLCIMGLSLFLGNILITSIWKLLIDNTKEPYIIAFMHYDTDWIDFILVLISLILVVSTGELITMQHMAIGDSASWWESGYGFFMLAILIWLIVLVPIQTQQTYLAQQCQSGKPIPKQYWRLTSYWRLGSMLGIVFTVINIYLLIDF